MDNSLETDLDDMGDEAYEDGVAKVTRMVLYEKCWFYFVRNKFQCSKAKFMQNLRGCNVLLSKENHSESAEPHLGFVKVLRIHQCPSTGQRKIVCTPSKSQQSYMVLC